MQPGCFRGNGAALVQDSGGVRFLRGTEEPREAMGRLHGVDCEAYLERAVAGQFRGIAWPGRLGMA
eukprot:1555324-Heterocapsa_arctica.AAC.1